MKSEDLLNMRNCINIIFVVLVFVVILAGNSFAGEGGHYPLGSEGIKGGTIPPPGIYYRMYNSYYYADSVTGGDRHHMDLNYKLGIFANVHRVVWVTNRKFFGADYFMDMVVPVQYIEVEAKSLGSDDHEFGLGDINMEPFGLAWHQPRYDVAIGLSLYMPTGKFDRNNPASPGKDFWTQMATVGLTYYPDAEKSWSAAVLARYEIHGTKDHSDVRPGRNFLFEWGIGKMIDKVWEAGVSGYCQWQVGEDSGSDVMWDKSIKDRVYAIGPEINYSNPASNCFVSLRYLKEFGAVDRSEGGVTVLTVTRRF